MTAAVFAISAAALAFEIVLLRIFAIEHYHHFAYAVVSIAMLGGGASGTLLVLLRDRVRGREERLFRVSAAAFVVLLAAAPWIARQLPFEPTALAWSGRQWGVLLALYVTLALPFAAAAAAVILALLAEPARIPARYAASLAGSGMGALVALACLFLPAPWTPHVTSFKALPQVEAYPGARKLAERWSPLGWLVAVQTPAFHYAPGLSLGFRGSLPPQTGVFLDGDLAGAATGWAGAPDSAAFLDWLPAAAAYRLGAAERVLVIGAGAGLEVLSALAHGAGRVVAVELNPQVVRLASALDGASNAYGDRRVEAVIADARSFAARSRERYDLVVISPGEPFGASAAGVHALAEDYLTTVEALRAYVRLLAPGGVLAITRWVRSPPRDNVRMILTAAEALRASGDTLVGRHLAFIRGWSAATLLVKPQGFTGPERDRLRAFASSRLFDLDWLAGEAPTGSVHNRLERPVYAEAAAAATGPESAAAFSAGYVFDVRPATDDRPYPSHYLRFRLLGRLLAQGTAHWLPFAEWGYVAVLATLLQGAVVAAVLMLVPAAALAGRLARSSLSGIAVYFSAIGLGYLLVEIAFIQKLQLLLGHPVYAVSATLVGFLACSGLGSWWSARFAADWRAPALVALLIACEVVLAPAVARLAAPLALPYRSAAALLMLAPLATAMGAPFPGGVRALVKDRPGALAWAWAANGFASVVAPSLATIVAIELGFRWVLLFGAACYGAAALAIYLPRQIFQRSTISSPRRT